MLNFDVDGRKRPRVDRETRVCSWFARPLLRGLFVANSKDHNTRAPVHYIPPNYSLNKSVGHYMTTPSSGTVQVLGVLVDPAQVVSLQGVSLKQTVHEAIQSLWGTFCERVGKDLTPETTFPSIIQVLIGEIGPFTHFKVLTCFLGYQSHI